MKTSYIVGAVVVVVIIIGAIWFMGQSYTPSATTQQPPMQMPTGQTQTSSQTTTTAPAPVTTPTTPQTASVAISNFTFSPNQISVKAGTKITWTNSDSAAHTVTSNNGAFNSGTLNPGSSYSFTFNTPGTYNYHCAIHPSMTATVIVTQ
jgi:plastocyanin